jgi:DNA-binding MarR family transcriptional regulator
VNGTRQVDPSTPPVAPPQPRLSYLIGRLERALRRQLDEGVRPHGLTTQQYTALSVLRARSGLSNAQLARRSLMTPQSMSEVIGTLGSKGFVRREADPTHGRIIRTELTPTGAAALAACDKVVDQIEEQVLRELTARDRERLLGHLRRCVHAAGAGLADL